MTRARQHLTTALADVDNLLNFHQKIGGVAQGRRSLSLSSLNKSGVVLLCASWETYIESVVREVASAQIRYSTKPADLPKPIHKLITTHIRGDKNESVWKGLVGKGWKDVANSVVAQRTMSLNTPKPGPIRELFSSTLGISDVTEDWLWMRNPHARVVERLNDFVSLRGDIAHGAKLPSTVKKSDLTYAVDLILRLAEKTDLRANRIVRKARRQYNQ